MGGHGSGRSAGYGLAADTCEDFRSIDFAWMQREAMLEIGNSGNITWSCNGVVTGWIEYRIEKRGLRLIYRTRSLGSDWQRVDEVIPLSVTLTNFNGTRRWFLCPSCQRRCRIIYGGTYFRCRTCHGLKYKSQYETGCSRSTSRRHKLRARLGQSGSLQDAFPPKPKGMHWKTYRRLREEDERLGMDWCRGMAAWLQRTDPRRK